MLDEFDQLISKQALPQLSFVGLCACTIGEGKVLSGQLLNHLHSLLNVGRIMPVIVAIQEERAISDEPKLAIGLALEVIAPKHGANPRVERPHHHYFFSVLEPVDLVEVADCLHHVLGAFEVDMLILVFYGVAVAHEAAAVAALYDNLVPIIEISSSLEAQNALEETHIGGPVDRRPRIYEIVLRDELITLMQAGGQILLHAPPEIYLLPEDEQLVGDDIEVQRIGGVSIDGVRRAIHAHRTGLKAELHLAEEVDALRA